MSPSLHLFSFHVLMRKSQCSHDFVYLAYLSKRFQAAGSMTGNEMTKAGAKEAGAWVDNGVCRSPIKIS